MGRDKALLDWGGRPLLEHVCARLSEVAEQIIVVADSAEKYRLRDARVVGDRHPGDGPLGGLITGLAAAKGERAVCVACDMPFIEPRLLSHLARECSGCDAAFAELGGHLEPLCAAYDPACAVRLERQFAGGVRSLQQAVRTMNIRVLGEQEICRYDPELRSFLSVNSPAEYEAALARR